MKRTTLVALITAVAFGAVMAALAWRDAGPVLAVSGQNSKRADVLTTLRDGSWDNRLQALETVRHTDSLLKDPEIRGTLRQELNNANEWVRSVHGRATTQRVSDESAEVHGEYHLRLVKTVAQCKDPAMIGVLADAAGTGPTAWHALAEFGSMAVGPVVDTYEAVAARSSGAEHQRPDYSLTMSGLLRTLALVAEQKTPLSADDKRRIDTLNIRAMEKPRHSVVLIAAIDLAASSSNQELQEDVALFAGNPSAAAQRLDDDPDRAEDVSRHAKAALGRLRAKF
ncbi:MAG: hypothetical protein U0163_22210 [Gemmatimonadaceae bacterium]